MSLPYPGAGRDLPSGAAGGTCGPRHINARSAALSPAGAPRVSPSAVILPVPAPPSNCPGLPDSAKGLPDRSVWARWDPSESA